MIDCADNQVEAKAFPHHKTEMILGALIAGAGLFLIGAPTSGNVTIIVGLILFLLGIAVFIF